MKYTKTISTLALSAMIIAQTSTSVLAATEIVPLDNVIKDFLWFDNEGDIREISLSQTHNTVTENGITTYYNTYGDAIMRRSGSSLTVNLGTDEDGTLTRWAKATVYQSADGEKFSSVKHYEIINGEEKITKIISPTQDISFTFDANGNRTAYLQAIKDANGNVTKIYTGSYTFDENGNALTSFSTTKDANGDLISTHESNSTFDKNGNVLTSLSTSKDANGNIRSSHESFNTFDENNNRTTYGSISKDANGNITNNYEGAYTYDENEKVILQVSTPKDANGNIKFTTQNTYIYDENGNKTSHISSTIQLSGFTSSHGEEFTFDDNGNKTSSIIYNKNGNSIHSSWENDYSYDNNGNLISTTSTGKDSNGDTTYTAQYNYSFDGNGNKTAYVETSQDANGDPRASREHSYTYDDNGNMITDIDIRKDANGNQTGHYENEYTYDSNGKEIGQIIRVKDTNGNVTISRERTYLSDENGKPITDIDTIKDANGNVMSVSKKDHNDFFYDESVAFENGETSTISVDTSIEYTTYEEDGSYAATTIAAVNEGASVGTVDSTWLKDFSSSIDSLNTDNYTPAGAYEGYQKTDLNYDANGDLTGSTKVNYTGDKGSEIYSGKTEYGNYTYVDEKVSGYTKTTYDANNNVTETTTYSNTQYDSYGRKKQTNYSTTDATGTVTDSGTKTY